MIHKQRQGGPRRTQVAPRKRRHGPHRTRNKAKDLRLEAASSGLGTGVPQDSSSPIAPGNKETQGYFDARRIQSFNDSESTDLVRVDRA
jgi:hypothetical protein